MTVRNNRLAVGADATRAWIRPRGVSSEAGAHEKLVSDLLVGREERRVLSDGHGPITADGMTVAGPRR